MALTTGPGGQVVLVDHGEQALVEVVLSRIDDLLLAAVRPCALLITVLLLLVAVCCLRPAGTVRVHRRISHVTTATHWCLMSEECFLERVCNVSLRRSWHPVGASTSLKTALAKMPEFAARNHWSSARRVLGCCECLGPWLCQNKTNAVYYQS